MVKRASPAVLRLLPLLLLPALLAGCGFFTTSLFPGYLAQAEASFELDPAIDSFLSGQDYSWYNQVFILRGTVGLSAGSDYGAVLIELDSLPDKLLLLVDPAGNLRELSSPALGRLHLADVAGDFVVGSLSFPPDSPGTAVYRGLNSHNLGFSDGSRNYQLWTDGGSSNLLYWQSFDSNWAANASKSVAIHDLQAGYELRGVYYDPAAAKQVILVFHNYVIQRIYVFFLPVTGFDETVPFTTPLVIGYPPLGLEENMDANAVIYTRKGIAVADHDGGCTLLSFSGVDTGKGLNLGQRGEVRLAFDLEGENFYAFSPEDRRLYRGKTGW